MKKTLLIVGIVVLALGALGVGVAFAQGGQPPYGPMMGGNGYGWMHDYVEQALAAKLGLTEEQVEGQLAMGTSMYQIALNNGIAQADLADFMNEVHQTAFDQAIKDGVLTQAQADWMLQHMSGNFQNGYGFGDCPMHNGQNGSFGPQNGRGGYGPGMMGRGFGS